jgi:hypothetical protein
MGPAVAAHYCIKDATRLSKQGFFGDAALVLQQNGAPANAVHIGLYVRIAVGVLALTSLHRSLEAELAVKEVLFIVYSALQVCSQPRLQHLGCVIVSLGEGQTMHRT